jgi:hypothetical protein
MVSWVHPTAVESLRDAHKPAQVRFVFIGESAPAGDTFFYAANSTLYFETRAAFERAFPLQLAARPFLEVFVALGCYLDDLCLEPVNNLPDPERQRKRTGAVASLASRLRSYDPQLIIAIGKTTAAPHVQSALQYSGLTQVPFRTVAFPGRPAHKIVFHREIDQILRLVS